MRQVDDYFSPKATMPLFHYTGIGGLLGIVGARAVWASHAYYMNDSREIIHAAEVLQGILRNTEDKFQDEEQVFVRQFCDWLNTFRRVAYHVFVFALSEQPSLLSQWRSYAPHGKGVSLGFAPATVNHILGSKGFRLAKCIYASTEHAELMQGLLQKMLVTFRQRLPSLDTTKGHESQKYHGFLEEFRGDVLQVMAIIKHPAFREEQEWRIVSPYFAKYTVPEVRFREGASMLLPYVELKLPEPSRNSWFTKVVLGPSADVNLSHSALSSYLSNQGVCNLTENSGIPLRQWRAT